MCDRKASDQPAHTHTLIRAFPCRLIVYSMSVKLLNEYHLEFLSLMEAAQARLRLHLSNATLLEITCSGSYVYHARIQKVLSEGVQL